MTEPGRNRPGRSSAPPARRARAKFSHATIDRRNVREDRLLARRLRRDRRLLGQARANLHRWMARDGKHVRQVFAEWDRILELSADQIADFLISDTPMARRLRQSSPFLGLMGAVKPPAKRRS